MSVPTIIRADINDDVLTLVITSTNSFTRHVEARVQTYRVSPSGQTHFEESEVWASELGAIKRFNEMVT